MTRAPPVTALETPIRVAGTRWTIDFGFKPTKGEVGLDQYAIRRDDGWYRHITLALLALAYLAALRAGGAGQKFGTALRRERLALSVPEMPGLLA